MLGLKSYHPGLLLRLHGNSRRHERVRAFRLQREFSTSDIRLIYACAKLFFFLLVRNLVEVSGGINAPLFDQLLVICYPECYLLTILPIMLNQFKCSMKIASASARSHIAGPSHRESSRTVDFGGQNCCATQSISILQYHGLCCAQSTREPDHNSPIGGLYSRRPHSKDCASCEDPLSKGTLSQFLRLSTSDRYLATILRCD